MTVGPLGSKLVVLALHEDLRIIASLMGSVGVIYRFTDSCPLCGERAVMVALVVYLPFALMLYDVISRSLCHCDTSTSDSTAVLPSGNEVRWGKFADTGVSPHSHAHACR
jgi:hypothetical protein